MVLEYLNQKPPEQRPRVIVLTANSRVPVVVKAMRLGASDFLEKPTTPEDLRISVAAALEESADAEPSRNCKHSRPLRDDEKLGPAWREFARLSGTRIFTSPNTRLAPCFARPGSDPDLVQSARRRFEAEGNRGAAKTFYQKAVNAPAGCDAAARNLIAA